MVATRLKTILSGTTYPSRKATRRGLWSLCSPRRPDEGVKSHDSKSSKTANLIRWEGAGVNIFETLREQVTIGRFIEPGSGGKAHCVAPGHQDNDPSMHAYDDHVHCFACGFHGDVVDVWAAMSGFDRPVEAALDLAREFGVSLPELSEEVRQKAAERREAEARHQSVAKASHRALERHAGVREWWEKRGSGDELQKRFVLGANKDGTEAVIPFWSRGRVLFLIRRKLQGEPKYILPSSEELPDGYKPLFI